MGKTIAENIGITPILRAGLGMSDAVLSLLPLSRVYHIGLFREKVSLQPVECNVDSFSSCFRIDHNTS